MRIRQIELNGFKSFMQRTVLELPRGVTAIVGPNGCGKSNIVDAIRWVLGEQSPRHLRGEAMEDVIFTGNTENGPLGMAEVALLLERDEADFARGGEASADDEAAADGLPPELATASEILVSRRYFRSGESEYAINRAPCRLKDITELFLGTGVGTKAYAIIEQGRVDQLINANPEELRVFIEEAAGTTRFRSRKVAAERKMERTRENLLRVQDILRELERQMASLERQARRAEEYHRIKQEVRGLDLRGMAVRQRSWSAEVAALSERLAALQAEEAASAEATRTRRGASDEAHAARATNEERLRAVEGELTAERLAAAEAQARSEGFTERGRELAARAAESGSEAERIAVRLAELARETAALRAEVDRLSAELPEAEVACAEAEGHLEALAHAGAPLERAVEEGKDALLDALAEEARLRNLAEALRQRRDDLDGRRRRLEDEQRALGERLHANARAGGGGRARDAPRAGGRAGHGCGDRRRRLAHQDQRRQRYRAAPRGRAARRRHRPARPAPGRPYRSRAAALGAGGGAARLRAPRDRPGRGAQALARRRSCGDGRDPVRRGDRSAGRGHRRQRTAARGDAARARPRAARAGGRARGEPRAPGGRGARPRGAAGTRRRGGACHRRGGRAAACPRRRSGGGGEGPGAAGGGARADHGRARGGRARGGRAGGGGRRGGRGAGRARRAPNECGGGGRRAARAPGGAAGGPHQMARRTCRRGAPADRGRGASGGGLGALARGAGGREPCRRHCCRHERAARHG